MLNVIRTPDKHIMDDTDLAGPIFFCIMFGAFLLLASELRLEYARLRFLNVINL